ncbi:MAG TPA: proline dehydrogenase family protein [Longimicrobium sp.]|nr:proline dehydrogenase family protein [Longimicrobium sp.]
MSIARSLLLRASRSPWLAEQFRRRAFARRAVRRFMPGEAQDDALAASADFATRGIGTILTQLGERITSADEADRVRDHYLALLDTIARRGLPTQPSVKLTHLGMEIDRDACVERVRALARRAAETGNFVWVDIEESNYVDATLDVFRRVRAEHDTVGLCLQAYLRRTPADLASLLPLRPAIRLVKGAYREPPEIAFEKLAETNAAYMALADTLLDAAREGGGRPVFGTHDLHIVERIRDHADARGLSGDAWELHMLYGIKAADQRRLAEAGVRLRVLISYGSHWFPWYMRRLAERPANLWFVVKNLFG